MIRQMRNSRRDLGSAHPGPFVSMICIAAENIEQYPCGVINLIFAQFTADGSPTQGAVQHDFADKHLATRPPQKYHQHTAHEELLVSKPKSNMVEFVASEG